MMNKRYLKCQNCGKEMTIDKQKTGRKAKGHGKYYERRVSKKLSKALGLRFKPTPRSGGMHWAGDIICLDYQMRHPIECKNLENLSLLKVFRTPACLAQINWKNPEEEILIFNDAGTDIVVAHSELGIFCGEKIEGTTFAAFIKYKEEVYFLYTLNEFCNDLKVEAQEEGAYDKE